MDKEDNLAKKFVKLLAKIGSDNFNKSDFDRFLSWLKLLNLDKEDCINYLKVLDNDYFLYYSPSILEKIRKYLGYYLIFYRQNL